MKWVVRILLILCILPLVLFSIAFVVAGVINSFNADFMAQVTEHLLGRLEGQVIPGAFWLVVGVVAFALYPKAMKKFSQSKPTVVEESGNEIV